MHVCINKGNNYEKLGISVEMSTVFNFLHKNNDSKSAISMPATSNADRDSTIVLKLGFDKQAAS